MRWVVGLGLAGCIPRTSSPADVVADTGCIDAEFIADPSTATTDPSGPWVTVHVATDAGEAYDLVSPEAQGARGPGIGFWYFATYFSWQPLNRLVFEGSNSALGVTSVPLDDDVSVEFEEVCHGGLFWASTGSFTISEWVENGEDVGQASFLADGTFDLRFEDDDGLAVSGTFSRVEFIGNGAE
jgi:hypothetical protein